MTLTYDPEHVYECTIYFPLKGHIDILDLEIHPDEVQQFVRVSCVGILDRLVSGFVIPHADSNHHGLQTGQKRRDFVAGQW